MSETTKLLIVQDDRILQIAFSRMIDRENLNYDFMIVDTVREALAILKKEKFDIVVTDYLLEDGSGFDILDVVREDIPVIFITGIGDETTAVRAIQDGAADYLTKSIGHSFFHMLTATIQKAIRRKRIEDMQRKLTHVVEQSPSSVVITDLEGNIEYVNPRFTEFTGYSSEDVMGRNPRILNSGQNPKGLFIRMWDTIKQGKEWRGELCNRKKNGELYWELASFSSVKDGRGNMTHYFKVAEDITELKQLEQTMRNRNEIMERDLEVARNIHSAFLPDQLPQMDFVRVVCWNRSLDAVGGDYFGFFERPPDRLGLFIGDVQGHGVSAALYTALVKFMTESMYYREGLNPSRYMTFLNHELLGNMPNSLLAALYGLFTKNRDSGEVEFCFSKAGLPLPFLYESRTEDIRLLECHGTYLGILNDIQYEMKQLTLRKGDRLFIYTDGITETINPDRELLEYEGFYEILKQTQHPDLEETLAAIFGKLSSFRRQVPITDDIVLIGVEVL